MQKIKKEPIPVFKSTENLSDKLFHCSIRERTTPMQLHMHEFYEIHLVVDGSVDQIINGEKIAMKKGDFYFLNPFDLHEYIPNDSVTLAKVQFDLSILNDNIKESVAINNKYCICNVQGSAFERIYQMFQEVEKEEKNTLVFNSVYVSCLLTNLLIALLRKSNFQENKISNEQSFNSALSFIHTHYAEDITLNQVSNIAGFTPNYFCALFKQKFNVPLKTYIRNLRLNKAISMLKSTNNRVSDIAYTCGYNSFSQFSADFKNFTGKTPRKYKQEL